jgi:YggT family protein
MDAVSYIVGTLLSLYLYVLLLRFIMQLSRADFRNPLAQAIVKLTNPLVLPLRKILPPAGKIDSASVVAILIYALAVVAILSLIGTGALPATLTWFLLAAREIAKSVLWLYFFCIFLYALLSLVAPGQPSPISYLLGSICEPVLAPIRRFIPSVSGLDLSPLWAGIAIQALLILLR